MHYFGVVLVRKPEDTPPAEILAIVENALAPFDENLKMEPYKAYLDERELAMMRAHYETRDPRELANHMQDWKSQEGAVDEGGLYAISTYNQKRKWDWWRPGGRWNGVIRHQPRDSESGFNWEPEFEQISENVALVKRLDHEVTCHAILTPEGVWHEVERLPDELMYWRETGAFVSEDAWRAAFKENDALRYAAWKLRVRELLAEHSRCLAVGIDYHI